MLKIVSTLFALLFLILGLSLGFLNPTQVTFDYYLGEVELPLSILLGVALVVGVLLTLIYSLWNLILLKLKVRSLSKSNAKQLNELIELRKAQDSSVKQVEKLQQELDELDSKNSDLIMLADSSSASSKGKS